MRVNPISDSLCKRLLENGMPQERIDFLKKGGRRAAAGNSHTGADDDTGSLSPASKSSEERRCRA